KAEHNDFTGLELQPSVRLGWTPNEAHTVWGAVSRAVRTPTRIDEDFRFRPTPGVLAITGDRGFEAEKLWASEVGYRVRPHERLSLDLATFYNIYDDLRSLEVPAAGTPIMLRNRLEGETYGAELTLRYQALEWWRLKGNYTYLHKDLDLQSGSSDPTRGSAEGNDPRHMFALISFVDLGEKVSFDQVLRYVDTLPEPRVAAYLELDLRVAWHPCHNLEVALVGQNLLHEQHREFVNGPVRKEVQRGVYGKVTWTF
ncbi:MAG TPA: TonB-dependent receptor, partial [Verrucomicrobiae bacterium]|nr:TonB-dependent receptor [Verrucomicrobiae bacterium]